MKGGLWNYVAGYVMIQVEGLSLERFVNRALINGIRIWGVRRNGALRITAYLPAKDFYALHSMVRNMRCRVRILEKYGLPFVYTRFRMRPILLFGWALVAAAIFVASHYIWFIDISGCSDVSSAEVAELLASMDVRAGIRRSEIRTSELGTSLMTMDDRIAWAGAKLSGVVLSVEIVEADGAPDILDLSTPQSIYATRDGVIESIVALNGKAVVKPGDIVKAGDLLITGDIGPEGTNLHVAAVGEVQARVMYVFEGTQAPRIEKLARTGLGERYQIVELPFFSLSNMPQYEAYELEGEASGALSGGIIPFSYTRGTCYELKRISAEATEEEQIAAATKKAEQALYNGIAHDAVVISKDSRTEMNDDGSVTVTITVITTEYIGEAKPIQKN